MRCGHISAIDRGHCLQLLRCGSVLVYGGRVDLQQLRFRNLSTDARGIILRVLLRGDILCHGRVELQRVRLGPDFKRRRYGMRHGMLCGYLFVRIFMLRLPLGDLLGLRRVQLHRLQSWLVSGVNGIIGMRELPLGHLFRKHGSRLVFSVLVLLQGHVLLHGRVELQSLLCGHLPAIDRGVIVRILPRWIVLIRGRSQLQRLLFG